MHSMIRFADGRIVPYNWLAAHTPDAEVQRLLGDAYARRLRPVCLCQAAPLSLYIRRMGDGRHVLSRMPGTRQLHAPDCELFMEALESSGKSCFRVLRDGSIRVRLAEGLADPAPRSPATVARADTAAPSGRRPGTGTVGLESLLRLLWSQAGLNSWHPGNDPHRHWSSVQPRLMQAAEQIILPEGRLADQLFLPLPWRDSQREQIQIATRERLARLAAGHRRAILVGQVRRVCNEWLPAAEGRKSRMVQRLYLQHLGMPVALSRQLFSECLQTAGDEWQVEALPGAGNVPDGVAWAWPNAREHGRLVCLMLATVSRWREGYFYLTAHRLAFLRTSLTHMPCLDAAELRLAEALVGAGRAFSKPLRAQAGGAAFQPDFLLLDHGEDPLHLAIARGPGYAPGRPPVWVWHPGAASLPEFPARKN